LWPKSKNMKNTELGKQEYVEVGDRTFTRQVGVDGLLNRPDVGAISGGRRYDTSSGITELAKLIVLPPESDNVHKGQPEWNPHITTDEIKGF